MIPTKQKSKRPYMPASKEERVGGSEDLNVAIEYISHIDLSLMNCDSARIDKSTLTIPVFPPFTQEPACGLIKNLDAVIITVREEEFILVETKAPWL